ncbi:PREDICTED: ALBINO3-like protein 2, chloroplastic [Ipomoea nil]|uniref:ALBINO3-like protein 2, chloroplastic n=1 Tax=Ipomoea nil TaxID=35883 RepID=UPI000900F8ED|nr:PREDICTED: ALBINO3-like protein 2, chloroplastic [Ipomoea nil]
MLKFLQRRFIPRVPSTPSYYFPHSFTQSHGSSHRRRLHHLLCRPVPPSSFASAPQFLPPFHGISSPRSFSTRESDSAAGCPLKDDSLTAAQPFARPDPFLGGDVDSSGNIEDLFLPVSKMISLVDGYHDLSGLPWWAVIASGTLAMRLALFPFIILLIRKMTRIGEILPNLPSPFAPPKAGKSYKDQIKLMLRKRRGRTFKDRLIIFLKEKREADCPSFVWFFAAILQVPYFLLWLTTVRRMSLDHHDGFDCGGILWFQNLSELPNGTLGSILPLLAAGLYFANVKVSYQKSSIQKMSEFAKWYKLHLEVMTLPTMFIAFHIPQGSLICWVTNSSFSLIQQIALRNPYVCRKLGIPDRDASALAAKDKDNSTVWEMYLPSELREIVAQNISSSEMVKISTKLLAEGEKDVALPLLRLTIHKDPENIRALAVLGQALLHYGYLVEATEYLEHAISKLLRNGNPTGGDDVDLLILSSEWAGVAYMRQGKFDEGMTHLKRIATMKEPEDPNSKANYYEGLVVFSSGLCNVGRKAEAANYLRMAAAYDDSYKRFLEECEEDLCTKEDEFVDDLVNSRRVHY